MTRIALYTEETNREYIFLIIVMKINFYWGNIHIYAFMRQHYSTEKNVLSISCDYGKTAVSKQVVYFYGTWISIGVKITPENKEHLNSKPGSSPKSWNFFYLIILKK